MRATIANGADSAVLVSARVGGLTMVVRTFPLWKDGKYWPGQTHEDFSLRDLPFESATRKPAGRFNHWRLNLRQSPDGTLVLFVRRQTREILAFARLKGSHHEPDEYSVP